MNDGVARLYKHFYLGGKKIAPLKRAHPDVWQSEEAHQWRRFEPRWREYKSLAD